MVYIMAYNVNRVVNRRKFIVYWNHPQNKRTRRNTHSSLSSMETDGCIFVRHKDEHKPLVVRRKNQGAYLSNVGR